MLFIVIFQEPSFSLIYVHLEIGMYYFYLPMYLSICVISVYTTHWGEWGHFSTVDLHLLALTFNQINDSARENVKQHTLLHSITGLPIFRELIRESLSNYDSFVAG